MPNSGLKKGLWGWYLSDMKNIGDHIYTVREDSNFVSGRHLYFYGKTLVNGEGCIELTNDFETSIPKGEYTFSLLPFIYAGTYDVCLRLYENNENWKLIAEVPLTTVHGNTTAETFYLTSSVTYGRIIIKAKGYNNPDSTAISIAIGDMKLESGNNATRWQSKEDELYTGNVIIDHEGVGVVHNDGFESKLTPRELHFKDNLGRKHMALYQATIKNYDWTAEERFLGQLAPTILPINQGEAGMSYLSSQFGKYFVLGLDSNVQTDTDEFNNVQHFFRVNYQELGGEGNPSNHIGTHILSHPLYCHVDLKTFGNMQMKEGKEIQLENAGVIRGYENRVVIGANKYVNIGSWSNDKNDYHAKIEIVGPYETHSNTYWNFNGYTM